MKINTVDLKMMDYGKCLELQNRILELRDAEKIDDTLLMVEHPVVLTQGRISNDANILTESRILEEMGIEVFKTSRGGDVTYHGPGQIVGYPIINLKKAGLSVKDYLDRIQEVFIRMLEEEYGIIAHKEEAKYTGVWIGQDKVTAIGIHVKRMITMHGFAMNINTNLDHFSLINPCGLSDRRPTSLKNIIKSELVLDDIKEKIIRYFGEVFNAEMVSKEIVELTEN